MTLTLDAQLEQRIQREIELGHGRNAVEVITRALDLAADESWPDEEKAELDASYERGMAAIDRGEGTSREQLLEQLAQRRASLGR